MKGAHSVAFSGFKLHVKKYKKRDHGISTFNRIVH